MLVIKLSYEICLFLNAYNHGIDSAVLTVLTKCRYPDTYTVPFREPNSLLKKPSGHILGIFYFYLIFGKKKYFQAIFIKIISKITILLELVHIKGFIKF
jgi:hypothetical protein